MATLGLLAGLSAGCPGPTCPSGFIGTPGAAPAGSIVFTDGRDPTLKVLTPGEVVPLEPPPQGGYVMYVAAKLLNVDACVEWSGVLRDPGTGIQVGMDGRTATLHKDADGYGVPDGTNNANLTNINACPDYTSPRDVHAQPYSLELTVIDRSNRVLRLTSPVVPTCELADPVLQADCVCTCSVNYFLGKCGARDLSPSP